MIEHEIQVMQDGSVSGALDMRQFDQNSHTLKFKFPFELEGRSVLLKVMLRNNDLPYIYDCEPIDGHAVCTLHRWEQPGTAQLQLEVHEGDSIVWQSVMFEARPSGSIDPLGGMPPEEGRTMLDELQDAADEALEAAEEARKASGLKVIDYYDTPEALEAAVTAPNPGDAYGVGAAVPYEIYIYAESGKWINNGHLQGVPGPPGKKGDKGEKGDTGPVKTVNAVAPDAAGNVKLTPSAIGAAKESHPHGPISSVGAIGIEGDRFIVTGPNGVLQTQTPEATRSVLGAADLIHAPQHGKGGGDPITPQSIGAGSPPTTTFHTLRVDGWTDGEQIILSDTILDENTAGDLFLSQSATDEEFEAWNGSQPFITDQQTGSITVTVKGALPPVDIPVILEVRT